MWPGPSPSAVVNGAAGMIIAALLIAALYAGHDLFVPLALAGLLEFVLAPLVRRLTNWGLPKGLSVALVIVLVLANWQFQTADARVKLKRLCPQFG
jgi:predicted PurR-regulated permease PerM